MRTHIEKYYGFTIDTIEPLGDGQTSEVLKITTNRGNYVLKSQLNKDIAINEFRSLHELSKIGISPEPVSTVEDQMFIDLNGSIYILMKYIETDGITRLKLNPHILGKTINVMHENLNKISLVRTKDRFDEKEMIEKVADSSLLQILYEKYREYRHEATKVRYVIHGDLGSWNLIQNDDNIFIIDFGEVKYGNPYFDMAAIIESFGLNDVQVNQLLKGYGNNNKESFNNLEEMRRKWILRGIIFLAAYKLKTKDEVLTLLEEL